MKRLFTVMSASLIALLSILIFGSCDVKQKFKQEILKEDSLMVRNMMEAVDNPTFTSVDDVMAYYHGEMQYRAQDSVFFSIPQSVIPDIISVLQKNHDPVTKESIANEFESNKRIYLNLPNKPDAHEVLTPPDIPNTKIVDTVIDGKKTRILESESGGSTITITRNMEE